MLTPLHASLLCWSTTLTAPVLRATRLRAPLSPVLQLPPDLSAPGAASPLFSISSEAEFSAVLDESPPLGVTLVMLYVRGDTKAARVKQYLVDKCADNDMLQRLTWECAPDDAESLALAQRLLGADESTRMPYLAGFDARGERVLDFVAQSPSALFYGLEDLGGVLDAIAEESDSSAQAAAEPTQQNGAAAPGSSGASDARVGALETEVFELRMQISRLQAELFGANLQLEKLGPLVDRVAALEARSLGPGSSD